MIVALLLACYVAGYSSSSAVWSSPMPRSSFDLRMERRILLANSREYPNSTLDDPLIHATLMAIYSATSGPTWTWVASGQGSASLGLWGTPGLSYCLWFGVECCLTTPMSQLVGCTGDRSVSTLSMANFGMLGYMPPDLGNLTQLSALDLGQNPGLEGALPMSAVQLTQLLWLSVEVRVKGLSPDTPTPPCRGKGKVNVTYEGSLTLCCIFSQGTGLNACIGGSGAAPVTSCELPPFLFFNSSAASSTTAGSLRCPSTQLSSFAAYTASLPPSLVSTITLPFPPPSPIGSVIGGSGFTGFSGCSCSSGELQVSNGVASCPSTSGGGGDNKKYIIAIVLVAILPMAMIALGAFIFIKWVAWKGRRSGVRQGWGRLEVKAVSDASCKDNMMVMFHAGIFSVLIHAHAVTHGVGPTA